MANQISIQVLKLFGAELNIKSNLNISWTRLEYRKNFKILTRSNRMSEDRRNMQSLSKTSDIYHTSHPNLYLSLSESSIESNLKTGCRSDRISKKILMIQNQTQDWIYRISNQINPHQRSEGRRQSSGVFLGEMENIRH